MPDKNIPAKKLFGIDSTMQAPVFSKHQDNSLAQHVPEADEGYCFDKDTTQAILAGFKYNRRVLIQGYHGTGKSTHIEQVASKLNWPCIRINLDGHISRIDLIGRDSIVLKDGKQVTEFKEGILPWAIRNGIALIFDEYDAGRPDVMFVLQRVLESEGKFTLIDQNKVIVPHPAFRLFATANTIGLGDASGLYHGTNPINQGQIDRWSIISQLNYLSAKEEEKIVLTKLPSLDNKKGKALIASMVAMAGLTREGFKNGDISTVMSPRTVINWGENNDIFDDVEKSFRLAFLNKCEETERPLIAEYYQRVFGEDLPEAAAASMQ